MEISILKALVVGKVHREGLKGSLTLKPLFSDHFDHTD